MNDREFKKRVKKLAKQNKVFFQETRQGKGSHARVYYANSFTTVKKGELGIGLLKAMCFQLGITTKELEDV